MNGKTRTFAYPGNGRSLEIDAALCRACGACFEVCPHATIAPDADGVARVARREACMECGACARACPFGAIAVEAGVGCAAAILSGLLRGTAPDCGCGGSDGGCGDGPPCC